MSTRHLSGIAEFIKSKHQDWSPATIKSVIMTTADITNHSDNPMLNEQHVPANFFAMGTSQVNPVKVANPGLVHDIALRAYIGYLCGLYIARRSL